MQFGASLCKTSVTNATSDKVVQYHLSFTINLMYFLFDTCFRFLKLNLPAVHYCDKQNNSVHEFSVKQENIIGI